MKAHIQFCSGLVAVIAITAGSAALAADASSKPQAAASSAMPASSATSKKHKLIRHRAPRGAVPASGQF